jgi:hypothetical protein
MYSTTLVEPEKLYVNLGLDRTLCQGQVVSIALPNDNLTYFWQKNGSDFHHGNLVEISEAGEYTVIAEDESGCKAFDTLHIETISYNLISEFWHSHEAVVDEDFVVANIGQTTFDSVSWSVSPTAQILSLNNDYLFLRFSDTGQYEIRLTTYKNRCFEEFTGVVHVISQQENYRLNSAKNALLSDLKLFPNPAREQFSFSVQSQEPMILHWTLTQVGTGIVVLSGQTNTDSDGFAIQQIVLHKLLRGVYVLRVFSGKEQLSKQLIIH